MSVAVIGSGMTGVFTAHALVGRGSAVTIIDVGETLDSRRSATVEKLKAVPFEQWPPADYGLIRGDPALGEGHLPRKLHFGSDYIYASDRWFARLTSLSKGRVSYPTFARGGFSNIWGAAVMPPDACDMADWPISRGELEPYLRKVVALMPLCGGQGNLSESFPPYRDTLGEVDPGPQGQKLLEDLRRAETRLRASGTLYGKARLAVHTAPDGEAILPCNGCGQCFTGCVRGSIFSVIPLLDAMVRRGQVVYRAGVCVDSIDEVEDKVVLNCTDLGTRQQSTLTFDSVFVAAGPINTTRLLLRSRRLYDQAVRLKESQKFVVPMLRLRAADTAIDHPSITLASVFLETKVPSLSDHWIHVQIVPMNPLILDGAGLPGSTRAWGRRLWAPALRRVMAAWCGMHSDHSSHVELRLRPQDAGSPDRLEMTLHVSDQARAAARRAARDLYFKGLSFRTLFCYWMVKFSNPGSGTHCGASFPMKRTPGGLLDSDVLGRPFGWKRVFAVDSSVLPSIPGTTLALSTMANAYRIASTARV